MNAVPAGNGEDPDKLKGKLLAQLNLRQWALENARKNP